MINQLFSHFQRPERGWDPVPASYARQYSDDQWRDDPQPLLDELEQLTGSFRGREVLDLGAGPGSYTLEFAKRGAAVTWYDISRNYLELARQRLGAEASKVTFAMGYLDEVDRLDRQFDFVFNRICWYYSASDRRFARLLHSMVHPGGWGYVVTPCLEGHPDASPIHRLRSRLNAALGFKIGHPFPRRGHFRRVWQGLPMQEVHHGTTARNVTVLFRR